jgi:hypothetical protein
MWNRPILMLAFADMLLVLSIAWACWMLWNVVAYQGLDENRRGAHLWSHQQYGKV